jgi:hypothetical protein
MLLLFVFFLSFFFHFSFYVAKLSIWPYYNISAKCCNLSKYTNPDCFATLKCRLHCFYEDKFIRGILYQGYIYSSLFTYFTMSSLLKSF